MKLRKRGIRHRLSHHHLSLSLSLSTGTGGKIRNWGLGFAKTTAVCVIYKTNKRRLSKPNSQ
ncbi:LOW QUALITY PROTEIN: uncharacterized protein LOC111829520 [Capsella rubella]|uniref:LOW QUALITY PROTEIN: uncharacterized protein LOC111829520 n=1 Tax=Capsella rubella TaxID=81985 RepID=UPI000CD4B5BC|nr:LOW QUALITY PROTEIN: uncharacterized protein LOC111829520 [Capsella rubella]